MKRAIPVILGFVVITIALTWVWEEGGRHLYGRFLKTVAPTIYDWIGFGDARVGSMRQRYINWIPFVGLMLVTPRLAARRRFSGLAGGLGLLFFGHLALNLTERMHKASHLPFVPSLLSDALPFLLWILFAWPVVSIWFASALAQLPVAPDDGSARTPASPPPNET